MGHGDQIMVTGFARLAKQEYPNLQVVVGNKKSGNLYDSVIFKNNPNITKASDLNPSINKVWIENYPGNRPYIKSSDETRIYWNPDYRPVKGDLYFVDEEMDSAIFAFKKINEEWNSKFGNKRKKIVFIEPSRKYKKYEDPNLAKTQLGELNRDWGLDNWLKLIAIYKEKILFIQSTHKDSNFFDGVYNYESDFRNACAMMSLCEAFIGWEGGFVHAAAALNKKAVVLYGGWVHPDTTGYNFHTNIYIDIEGSPCGMRNYCEHCNKCKDLITVEKVHTSLESIL